MKAPILQESPLVIETMQIFQTNLEKKENASIFRGNVSQQTDHLFYIYSNTVIRKIKWNMLGLSKIKSKRSLPTFAASSCGRLILQESTKEAKIIV